MSYVAKAGSIWTLKLLTSCGPLNLWASWSARCFLDTSTLLRTLGFVSPPARGEAAAGALVAMGSCSRHNIRQVLSVVHASHVQARALLLLRLTMYGDDGGAGRAVLDSVRKEGGLCWFRF